MTHNNHATQTASATAHLIVRDLLLIFDQLVVWGREIPGPMRNNTSIDYVREVF